jgi:hypothetical protein
VKPAQKRAVVRYFRAGFPVSERRAGRVVGIPRSRYRYRSAARDQTALRLRLRDLAAARVRYGKYETGSESVAEMDERGRHHQPRVHGSGLSHPTGEIYVPGYRFGMYRWHIMDPIRFQQELRVTIQALGWWAEPGEPLRYRPGEDDIASTALWYQTEPHVPHPPLPGIEALRVD